MPKVKSPSLSTTKPCQVDGEVYSNENGSGPKRSASSWLGLFTTFLLGSWAVYHVQFENLPLPLSAEQAGHFGFSEDAAVEHVKNLTALGPHSVGSDELDLAVQYVYGAAEKIKETAPQDVDVQVDLFHADIGANRELSGHFAGKTLMYSGLKHVIVKIAPKNSRQAEEDNILVSAHIDTVFSAEGAGDDTSSVSVMLELARGLSHQAHEFKNGVIFLFNTGEEEGLNGAHSFITQHPWNSSIRYAIDLEAMGIGGKSSLFQSPELWGVEKFAAAAKYPSGQVAAQDLFNSGVINSATDFQVYREVAGLSGLDFAYSDNTAVYHTKNDKFELLKPGSLQHLGDNMLPFLLQCASSSDLLKHMQKRTQVDSDQDQPIYFDILGKYMVVYSQRLATKLHKSVIFQAVLMLAASLFMGGYSGLVSFGISCLSIVLMWILSISLAIAVAVVLPLICPFSIPYIANPWLTIGLFGAPALLGAFIGQHVGFLLLKKYLQQVFSKRMPKFFGYTMGNTIEVEAERWLFKAGLVQWLVILILGTYFNVGSSYIALIWLVSPAIAYGLLEATFSSKQSLKQLNVVTPILGLVAPIVLSSGVVIRLAETVVGNIVRLDRNPGSISDLYGNLIVAILVAVVVSLMFVYLLPYVHLSGAKRPFVVLVGALLALNLALVSTGLVPAFTEDLARAVNVVHVVDSTGINGENKEPLSYISLFSTTPGKLTKELASLENEFACGSDEAIDFVTFSVKYHCRSHKASNSGWSKSEVPVLRVESDSMFRGARRTIVSVDTKLSTRWALKINKQEIHDFSVGVGSQHIVPRGDDTEVDGWHIIQFAGSKNSPTKFKLHLYWSNNATRASQKPIKEEDHHFLLKLRTDLNRITPDAGRLLEKLPSWCSLYGKSTFPCTFSFLTALPVNFRRGSA